MSIIYRALKKLQSDRESGEGGAAVSPPHNLDNGSGKNSAPRKRLFILLSLTTFVLLLAAAGLKLMELASEEPSPPPRPKRALPARPVAANSPAAATQPTASSKNTPVIASGKSVDKPQAEDTPEPAGGLESGDTPEPASTAASVAATPVTVLPASAADQAAPPADASGPQEPPVAQKTASKPAMLESASGNHLPAADTAPPEPLILDDPLPSDPAADPEYGKYQRSSKKQADTALTAARLQQAIRSNDQAGVERALDELARLKGRDCAYFLEMQAYWYLHAKRYDAAEQTLIRVLQKNPNSLHAGLNMAVLESLTGREAAARDRLQALAERFPDNPEVKALQRRLD